MNPLRALRLVVGVALMVMLAGCATTLPPPSAVATASPSPTIDLPSPACPYYMDWPPYDSVGVPSGLTVTQTGPAAVRVMNSSSHDWTVRGEWWEWVPCFGVQAFDGDPSTLSGGSSADLTIKNPGL